MNILEVKQLNKSYGQNVALKDINLEIPTHGIFGLLGPNGAGKTSLIRIINQIIEADSGEIIFKGSPLKQSHISQIGYLPEERGLYKKMKVWDQLIYFARLKGMSSTFAKERVAFWLEKMDIGSWRNKSIDDLSKGMAQKVQFISAVIHEPELLILDEPFSGFDPINAELIKNEILELRQKGITLVLSTHRMESVELLCDRIAMIHKATKVLEGKISEIKQMFRPNAFQVKLELSNGTFPDYWNAQVNDNLVSFEIKLQDQSTNELISDLMKYGNILGFHEILPTIEQIFIQQVKHHSDG